jgi:hypothetical protein
MADGIGLVAQSAYEYELTGSWPEYVDQNNHAALDFARLNPLGAGYGYILTSTSEDEYRNLKT